jgi:xylan 1,4-beta-xylosidase
MIKEKLYEIQENTAVPFRNNAFFCIGTGRMGLALQKQYYEQLELVQKEIGFSHIRGHGLFCDDLAIYHEFERDGQKETEYNFTYLDMVMDNYRTLNLKPFLELGFMPRELASGDQTVFYWKGNVTPPSDYHKWTALVQATLRHLIARYGEEEVVSWPVEVWNEPNLEGFWKGADMKEYFHLFDVTSRSVKEISSSFRVGGPAVCGGTDKEWITAFLDYIRENHVPLDFVTRHHYTTASPQDDGHYGYAELNGQEQALEQLEPTRHIVDSFPEFRGMEIHVTEFNTSYIPNCPLHDTNLNAAYIAYLLSRLGDSHASYSYWTFGDIFEEKGVPFTPFHGGFGLVANGLIPKPTFWAFSFFKRLEGTCVHRSDESVIMLRKDNSYCGVVWNLDCNRTNPTLDISFTLPVYENEQCLIIQLVDESCCNPLKIWHDIGEPANPSESQNKLLQNASHPYITTTRITAENKTAVVQLKLSGNAVCFFELNPAPVKSDRGYSYEKVLKTGARETSQ